MRLLLAMVFLLSFSGNLRAQEPLVTIKVTTDKSEVALDEYFNYKAVIASSVSLAGPEMKLPDLEKDFDILSSGRSQNIAISGGKTKIQIALDYFLKPKKEGEIIIGPIEVSFRGKNYTSESVTIKVGPARRPIPQIPQEEGSGEEASQEKVTL